MRELAGAIFEALRAQNYCTAFFLSRRLAAELAEDDWSQSDRFIQVKRTLCDGGTFAERELSAAEFIEALTSGTAATRGRFTVRVPVAPTSLARTVSKNFSKNPRLLVESNAEGFDVLTCIEVDVDACRVGEAAAAALDVARKILDDLRLVFYVRTHLSGSVVVRQACPILEVHLSLPQPFWSKAPGRREVPRLPKRFTEGTRPVKPSGPGLG